jgi:O-antigen/teichoic acid export membrane protein
MKKARNASPPEFFGDLRHEEDLKNKDIRGGSIVVTARVLTTVIQIGGTVVLARLLTPNDFGLVAMVTAITSVFSLFQDVGLTDATIQASEINHRQVSSLFWVNFGICFSITILLVALSPGIAWFYKNKELTPIAMLEAVTFVFWGLTFQHMALLKRKMLFVRVGMIGVFSYLISTIISVVMALSGLRYWAVVARDIMVSVLTALFAWTFCSWRPGRPKMTPEAKPLLRFGANSAGTYILNYLAKSLDKIIMGKKYGSIELGFYSRAYYLATTPTTQTSDSLFHVSVSTLSKLREDPEKYRRYYLNAIGAVSFIGMPLSLFMVVMSKELIYILLGPQWNEAAGMFSILGVGGGMFILHYTNGWLHVSAGRSDRWLKWGIINSSLLAMAFIVGSFYGPKGIAWGYSFSMIVLTFPAILFAGRPFALRFRQVFSKVWKSILAASLAAGLTSYLKGLGIFHAALFFRLTLAAALFLGTYLGLTVALNGGLGPIREMSALANIFLKRKPGGPGDP